MDKRKEQILEMLLRFEEQIKHIQEQLANYDWDSDMELVLLSGGHVASVLNRYLSGDITSSDVEDWANAVESREDIGFKSDNSELLSECPAPGIDSNE